MNCKRNDLFILTYCLIILLAFQANVLGYGLTGAKWAESDFPVSYYINQSGSADISDDSELTAIRTSFQTWTNVAGTDATVSDQGLTAIEGGAGYSSTYDSYNVLSWAEATGTAYTIVEGALAVCITWYNVGGTGYIYDSDIIFNGVDYTWTTTAVGGAMDVQNIATHEIGHFFGLGDLYDAADSEKTMYGYGSANETKKRNLHEDDVNGIAYLYPYAGILNFSANSIGLADSSWNVLSWTNPQKSTFTKTMIRYRTDGVYPTSIIEGTLLVERAGTVSATETYNHTNVKANTTYYYTAFAYDSVNGYRETGITSKESATVFGGGGTSGTSNSERSDCFIATACYGDYHAREVLILRKFRDTCLSKVQSGRQFIQSYYLVGPHLATIINNNPSLKEFVRAYLQPIVNMAEYFTTGGR
ncbi:MAG: matrixin family metalloprotease [PVC group bacterium]|nr:matrixin family metalloprotease [PVC group bacterium]